MHGHTKVTFQWFVDYWNSPACSYSSICFLSLRNVIIQNGQSITFLEFRGQETLRDANLKHT